MSSPDPPRRVELVVGAHRLVLEAPRAHGRFSATASAVVPGVFVVRVAIDRVVPGEGFALRASFVHPSRDVQAVWHPGADYKKIALVAWEQDGGQGWFSSALRNAPVVALIGATDRARLVLASSELVRPTRMRASIDEGKGGFACEVDVLAPRWEGWSDWQLELRIDTRDRVWTDALADVARWWDAVAHIEPAPVPAAADGPFFSTWYAFHRELHAEEVEREAVAAHALGCRGLLLDDGWELEVDELVADRVGDWKVAQNRFPDLVGHVARVKAAGLSYLMWYALPLVGRESHAAKRWEGKMLTYLDWAHAHVPDPRSPSVRQTLVETAAFAMEGYRLDGLKLDFFETFSMREVDRIPPPPPDADEPNVERAVLRLLDALLTRIYAIKPDAVIEFRQEYCGPLMRRYANAFRAHDCAYSAVENRMSVLDLRLLVAPAVVHGDMLYFRTDEPVEAAALQLLAVFFAVPQISVRADALPGPHRAMLQFLLGLWREHADVLLRGRVHLPHPELHYPVVTASHGEAAVVAVYAEGMIADWPRVRRVVVINASAAARVVVRVPVDAGVCDVRVFTCTGELRTRARRSLPAGVHELEVPRAGIVRIERLAGSPDQA